MSSSTDEAISDVVAVVVPKRRWWRGLARAASGATLLALLGAVPAWWALVDASATLRPLVHASEWRQPDNALVVAVGVALVLAAWLWFVAQVVSAVAVAKQGRSHLDAAPEARSRGWVARWVQFVVVSSSVLAAPSVARAAPASGSATHDPPALVSYVSGMVTAFLISAGAIGAVEARRRRTLERSVGAPETLPEVPVATRHVEVEMRRALRESPVDDVRAALRMVAIELMGDGFTAGERVVAVAACVTTSGTIEVHLNSAVKPLSVEWSAQSPMVWSIERGSLSPVGASVDTAPSVVQLGVDDAGGCWFVDLEAAGLFRVCSPYADDVMRTIAASLTLSSPMAGATLIAVGLDDVDLEGLVDGSGTLVHVRRAGSLAAAIDHTRATVGAVAQSAQHAPTQQLRARSMGERFEPTVVVAHLAGGDSPVRVRSASGVAVVVSAPVASAIDGWGLLFREGTHVVSPIDIAVTPTGVGHHDVDDVVALLHATEAVPTGQSVTDLGVADGAVFHCVPEWVEPDWQLMVRLFGQVEVVNRDGAVAEFERSKGLELVAWLCLHRGQSTRGAARSALWEVEVRPATFANVVSDARRGLGRLAQPPMNDEWIGRTLTEDLPLHGSVVTDADLLRSRLKAARLREGVDAIAVLRPGLELVRGTPLLDTGFLWADAEGHMSSLVMLATAAAVELGTLYLDEGDAEGVFWATGRGLAVLPGHEELVGIRMRAFAQQGDRAGVRHEWESYLRGLAADSWSGAEPAAKLKVLSAELLA